MKDAAKCIKFQQKISCKSGHLCFILIDVDFRENQKVLKGFPSFILFKISVIVVVDVDIVVFVADVDIVALASWYLKES